MTSSSALRRRILFWLLVTAALAAIVLGAIGNYVDLQKTTDRRDAKYALDVLYRTVQLFVFEFNSQTNPIPWPLEVARWLAGIVAGVALFQAAEEIFHRQLEDRHLRRLKGHVIVCGLGRKGFHLVQQLRARGDDVLVVEIDEGDDSLPTCQALGATILVGDARTAPLLRRAGVQRAARLIAVCKSDTDNIEVSLQAWELVADGRRGAASPLVCHVHIIDLRLTELFKRHKVFSCTTDPYEARIFSFYENAARALFADNPLDVRPHESSAEVQQRGVHLVIVGLGQMGESVALQAMRVGHFAGQQRLRITVFDPEAEGRRLNLLSRYPQLESVCDLECDARSVEHPLVRQQLADWAKSDGQRLIVAICIDDDPRALSLALHLPPILREAGVPVFVRQSERRGLASLIDDQLADGSRATNISSFGSPEVSAGLEAVLQEKLDELARVIHNRYVEQRNSEGADPASDPALLPWPQLSATFKSSNRQQADHIDVKLRAIGCRRLGKGEPLPPGARPFDGFTDAEVELLAQMEHARWCADRYLAGWRLGPADKPRQISPYLIPYDDLEDKIKEYDRQPVRQIPQLVAMAGQRIVRVG